MPLKMTEPGWPLIPREVLPAPVPAAHPTGPAAGRRRVADPRAAGTHDTGRQLSIFGVEATEPSPADLAGLLVGPGRLGRMGGTARVSVRVDAAWRVHVLAAELFARGLPVTWSPLPDLGPHPDGPPAATEDPAGADPARDDPARDDLAREDPAREDPAREGPAREGSSSQYPAREGSGSEHPPSADPARGDFGSEDAAGEESAGRDSTGAAARVRNLAGRSAPDGGPIAPAGSTATGVEVGARPGGVAGFEVRTAYSSRLNALARAWPPPADGLFLDGARLRLWVAAAGAPGLGGYVLGLGAWASGDRDTVEAALSRAGLAPVLSDDGLSFVITDRKRLSRLAELVGDRPAAAPPALWPGGATS
ncbi:hypothetical protein KRM28CT15_07280 [Krasilnikovia sp. M28-CT-15]